MLPDSPSLCTRLSREKICGGGIHHPHRRQQPCLLLSLPLEIFADRWAGQNEAGWAKRPSARDQYASGYMSVTGTFRTSPNHLLFSTGLPPRPSILSPILASILRLLASYAAVRRLPSKKGQNIEQFSLTENY